LQPQTEVKVESESSPVQIITNPILQDLADSKTYNQFVQKAENWKRQGKIVYGNRKASFIRPDNCHLAVFSSSGVFIALLSEGNDSRMDILTGKSILNPERQYSGNNLIWIQIN